MLAALRAGAHAGHAMRGGGCADDHATHMNVGEIETRRLPRKAIVGAAMPLPVLAIAMSHGKIEALNVPRINRLQFALTTPVIFWCGWQFFRSAWKGLRHFSANMDTLVAMRTGAEYLYSLAAAIVCEATARERSLAEPIGFRAVVGHGVEATVDGHAVLAGKAALLAQRGNRSALAEKTAALEAKGRTPVYVAMDGRGAGIVAVSDTVRPESTDAIATINALRRRVVMMTGDNQRTAEVAASQVGVDVAFADVLPKGWADKVKDLQAEVTSWAWSSTASTMPRRSHRPISASRPRASPSATRPGASSTSTPCGTRSSRGSPARA